MIFIIRGNIVEEKDVTMKKKLNFFSREITNMVKLQHYVEINDMIHMATNV